MSEVAIRIIVLFAWLFTSFITGVIMDSMFVDFEDIVLASFVLLSLFLLVYIALVNYSERKSPLLHPKNSAVCGANILFLALFRSMQSAGAIEEDRAFLLYIITTISAFVLNLLVFDADSYIPKERFIEQKVVKNEIKRDFEEGSEFDIGVFDSDKYEIDINYSAQYFDKSEKDASIHFQNATSSGLNKKGWYYAEIENKAMRDYPIAENADFDEFLLALAKKNARLIQPIYMCSYYVNGWEGVIELCAKITEKSLSPQMQVIIYFSQDDIDDFIEKMASMKGLSENMRGYFKWQFKGDFESLSEQKSVKKWGKTTFFDNSIVLKTRDKSVTIIKKADYIRLEIL